MSVHHSIPNGFRCASVLIVALALIGAGQGAVTGEDTRTPHLDALPGLPEILPNDLPEAVFKLSEHARRGDSVERCHYCARLAESGDEGIRGLILLMGTSDENLRWEAVAALGDGEPSALAAAAARAMLTDESWGVRSEAVVALGNVGDPSDAILLREVAESDRSAIVRSTADQAIDTLAARPRSPKHAEPLEREASERAPVAARTPRSGTESPSLSPMRTETRVDALGLLTPRPAISDQPSMGLSAPRSDTAVPTMPSDDSMRPRPGAQTVSSSESGGMTGRARRKIETPESVQLMPAAPAIRIERVGRSSPDPVLDEEVQRAADAVDKLVHGKIRQVGLEASPQADDGEFLRRTSLDLTGVIPTANDAKDFVRTGTGAKRQQTINRLVGSDGFFDHWSNVWTVWLVGTAERDSRNVGMLREWLRDAIEANMPYDRMVYHLLTTEGPTHEDGAANYLLRYDLSPTEIAARTSRMFLGLPLQCAECHDHKSEPWKQTDFYGVAAFFNSIEREEIHVEVEEDGEVRNEYIGSYLRDRPMRPAWIEDKEVSIEPAFLTHEPYRATTGEPPRRAYADWMTRPDNPYFARSIVNRIWAYFTGRGFVEPVDWFGANHSPTHPELLDLLANDFVAHGYNLRYLIRVILNTDAYQRSAKTTKRNERDDQYLTRARVRPLTAEQLFYSLLQATNIEGREKRRKQDFEGLKREYLDRYRFVFGNDEKDEEVLNKATVSQALMMLNGKIVNEGSLGRDGTRLSRILTTEHALNRRLTAIYLAVLSRLPTPREHTYFRQYHEGSGYRDEKKTYEDLYWSLLNSAEFASNH